MLEHYSKQNRRRSDLCLLEIYGLYNLAAKKVKKINQKNTLQVRMKKEVTDRNGYSIPTTHSPHPVSSFWSQHLPSCNWVHQQYKTHRYGFFFQSWFHLRLLSFTLNYWNYPYRLHFLVEVLILKRKTWSNLTLHKSFRKFKKLGKKSYGKIKYKI